MSYQRFAELTEQGESGVKTEEFESLFAPDADLYSPFLVKHVEGKSLTLQFMTEAFSNVGYPKYTHQFYNGTDTAVLLWESQGRVRGHQVQGTMVLTFDENGLIRAAKSYLRPLQVVNMLREYLFASAGAKLSSDYWKASPVGFAGDPSLLTHPTSQGNTVKSES
ncbi:nuclear transport factor 2 family protein [Ktedonospora formicarum]|uniref:SnoaL-like domain-containing protein n=1 Tax=Ktedonospora formicarum TaxID=2778364 RepID=A0A8J3MWX1_9CHLR|nr:nuclear transport factor 2 family protein [Ktedonospora formicarum]GHO48005.1 hypothetical protein KSX_61680 [Ktedonospora formicarum]